MSRPGNMRSGHTRHFLAALLYAVALLALAAPARAAEEPKPLGLVPAIQEALAYSPNLTGYQEDLLAAESKRKEAITRFLPTLSTEYDYFKTQALTAIPTKLGKFYTGALNTYQWSTTASQPLFTGFNLLSNYNLADLGVDLSQVQVHLTLLDVAYSVKKAYFGLLQAQKNLDVAQQQVVQLESHLKTARDFFDVGILPINDVLKVEVELAQAQQTMVQADNSVSVARATLNSLLGRSLDYDLQVEDILKHHPVPIAYDQARQTARVERPELKALDVQLRQSQESIRQAQSNFYPQLNLQASYVFTGENYNFGDSDVYDPTNWQVVTSLSWTFWEWGRTTQQVSQKRAAKRKLESTRQDLQDQVDLQVKQAWLGLRDAEKNIVTSEASIRSATENFRITQERFKEQLTTNTEVLDAQTLLTQARSNYYNALSQFNLAEAGLLRAMGRGLPEEALASYAGNPSRYAPAARAGDLVPAAAPQ